MSSSSFDSVAVVVSTGMVEQRSGTAGRDCEHKRNDPDWLLRFAMRPQLSLSPLLKTLFRVSPSMFDEICSRYGPSLARQHTRFCPPFHLEKLIAAFLMNFVGAICEQTATHICMGRITVSGRVHEVSRLICAT